jgi:hypothetical protein
LATAAGGAFLAAAFLGCTFLGVTSASEFENKLQPVKSIDKVATASKDLCFINKFNHTVKKKE